MERGRALRAVGSGRALWVLEQLTGKTATTSFSMRISWEGREGDTPEHQTHQCHGTAPRAVTQPAPVPGSEGCSVCQRSQPAAPSRAGTAPSPPSSLPGVCAAGRRRCGCQQRAEPGGEGEKEGKKEGRKERKKDSSSPRGQPCPPPLHHIPMLGACCPCSGSHMGFRGSLFPWKSISVSSLQRDKPSLQPSQGCRAAGAAEPDSPSFPTLISSATNG